jgi:alpha-beta hydrolase superfamily lysophospholipase
MNKLNVQRQTRTATLLLASFLLVFGIVNGAAEEPVKQPLQLIFKDSTYSFESLRALGLASSGGGETGEVLTALQGITEGNDESWYSSWKTMADRVARQADIFAAEGDTASARECYFRASQYYRSAEFFIHGDVKDPRINATWEKSRNAFLSAANLSGGLIKPVRIPYENTTLSGYFCRPDMKWKKRPLLIVMTGYDGTAEELYFTNAIDALKRGFNVLIFDGPGQGEAIHAQNLTFRADWEKVVTPVVDFALKLPRVNKNKIALMGISFGGYLAPHAAAYEHRIAALIANSAIYDWHAEIMSELPKGAEQGLELPAFAAQINKSVRANMKKDIHMRWAINESLYKFGAATPSDYFKMTKAYTNKGLADKITCPTLFVKSDIDTVVDGDGQAFFNDLTCPKKMLSFGSDFGAQLHCQEGSKAIANERVLNWLMQTFKMITPQKK